MQITVRTALWLVRNSTYKNIFTIKLKALLILFNVPRRAERWTLSQTYSNMISLQFQKDRETKHAREIASKNSIEQYFYNKRKILNCVISGDNFPIPQKRLHIS